MLKEWLEIDSFSPKEINEMFNAICINALHEKPGAAKEKLLGMKNAKDDTKVSLTHLMLLIEKNELDFTFKVTYLVPDKTSKPVEEPNFEIGLKEDPIVAEIKAQKEEVAEVALPPAEISMAPEPEKPKAPDFDASSIPEFKL